LVSLALALAPVTPVHARTLGPEPEPAEENAEGEDASAGPDAELLGKTGELFMAGQSKFDTADYEGAIELWTAAYNLLPATPEYAPMRGTLSISLANAQVEAYRIDKDVEHLRTADDLFTRYLEGLDADDEENRAAVQAEQDKIRPELERAEAEQKQREREAAEREAQAREEVARKAATERAAKDDWADTKSARRFRRMTYTGGALIGVGGVWVGIMLAGMGIGAAADRRGAELGPGASDEDYERNLQDGRAGNGLAWASGFLAGVFAITGAGMVIGGHVRRKKDLQRMGLSIGPGSLTLRGRF
jgi:hypothetical protein